MEVLRKSISAATLSVAFLLTACGNEGSTVEVPQQPAPVVKTLTTVGLKHKCISCELEVDGNEKTICFHY